MASIIQVAGSASIAGVQRERASTLKIAHVVDSMEMGGAEKLTTTLCRLQRDRGHRPTVHCLYLVGVLGEELQAEGFEVFLHQPGSLMNQIRSMYRALKRSRPDVVHCHNATAA